MILAAGAELVLDIDRLGAQGDGEARLDGQTLRLPGTLPGERWQARLSGRRRDGWDALALDRLAGPDRAEPACRHFGTCGGCRLQHAPVAVYTGFKRQRIVTALARRSLGEVEVAPPVISPPHSRRRLRLAWARVGRRIVLGLRERRSHRIVDLAECPVARSDLVALLPALRDLVGSLAALGGDGELQLTASSSGVDLLLDAARPPSLDERERLVTFARTTGLARLALSTKGAVDIVAALRAPTVVFGGTAVAVPPGAFLQATAEGEAALCARVVAALRPRDRVLDLYAGLGALGLAALAAGARSVHAVESDSASTKALAAARRPGLSVETRDLARRPLLPADLAAFDLAILDPPRAGADAQARALAVSTVPRLAYAACDPESFARDARTLVDGGYVLERVQPVDQFLWSAEVELVAALARPERRRRA
jgi:23S rRNA (uracil1939-C5)-methyltransferase